MLVTHVNLAGGYRGGERQTELLARCLAARSIRQRAVVRAGAPLGSRLESIGGLEVVQAPWALLLRPGGAGPCDVMHAHEGRGVHFAARAGRCLGVPYVITRRIEAAPRGDPWTRGAYRGAACIVAVSDAVAGVMRDYMPGAAIEVVKSTRSDLAADDRAAASIREHHAGRFLVGCVAALDDRQKGQTHLIDAMRQVAASAPDVHLLLIGDGRDRARLEERARGLANVTFSGFVENVGDYLTALDLFVLPSLMEGTPGVLLDAMGFGIPVIATRIGGVSEAVEDAVSGLLVPPGDPAALAEAISRLHRDSSLRAGLAEAGRRRVAGSTPEGMADAYLEIYQRAIKAGGRGAPGGKPFASGS